MTTTERAAQIWTVLIYAAYHRQTISSEVLGRLLDVPPGEVVPWLEPIRQYCVRRGLPPLASIVVGEVGDSVPGGGQAGLQRAQSSVFHYSWLDVEIALPGDLEPSSSAPGQAHGQRPR